MAEPGDKSSDAKSGCLQAFSSAGTVIVAAIAIIASFLTARGQASDSDKRDLHLRKQTLQDLERTQIQSYLNALQLQSQITSATILEYSISKDLGLDSEKRFEIARQSYLKWQRVSNSRVVIISANLAAAINRFDDAAKDTMLERKLPSRKGDSMMKAFRELRAAMINDVATIYWGPGQVEWVSTSREERPAP